eukprot:gene18779-biopygen17444
MFEFDMPQVRVQLRDLKVWTAARQLPEPGGVQAAVPLEVGWGTPPPFPRSEISAGRHVRWDPTAPPFRTWRRGGSA